MITRTLHISHTDIRSDSRILKEVGVISQMPEMQVLAIGVEDRSSAPASGGTTEFELATIYPVTRRLRRLSRPVYLLLAFIELTTRLIVKGFRYRPHIIHCHDTLVLPAGIFLKIMTGAQLIYDAHELESQKNGQTTVLSWATLMIERVCWPWVDGLVSVSDSIVAWYENKFSIRPTAVVLNSPVFINRAGASGAVQSKHLRDAFNVESDALIFIYVGILGKGRGIEELLKVFSDPAVPGHLVCMGYGDLAATIASVAKDNPKVHLHPPVPHHLVVEYASGADVGLCFIENVSLSDYYCLPNKLFEYCFAGVPVLASDFPEIRKVVERFALGQVCTPNGDAMRSAVLSFIANPPGRVSADLSPLSWERQAEKLVALYQTVLGQKSRPN